MQQPTHSHMPAATGGYVSLLGEPFYKIANYDALEPFFISLVSSFDHWLFISSSGGLTAGRVNAEQALFPYTTEDKITENSENTGSKTILRVSRDGKTTLWEPFSIRQQGQYRLERNLYKNIPGTALVFEEINTTLGLSFRYAWRTGEQFGFVKTGWLTNLGADCQVELLDGLQNILPANASASVQNSVSCLLDAYKRSELDPETGLGIFALNASLSDLPEPSESLLASAVFQVGLDVAGYLLSSIQLERFRAGAGIAPETEVRGRRGAFFAHASVDLPSGAESTWHIVADVSQDIPAIVRTRHALLAERADLTLAIETDLAANTARLRGIVASADGLQVSADPLCAAHHFANVMFNVMRGGIFANEYELDKADFVDFVATHHHALLQKHADFFSALPEKLPLAELRARAEAQPNPDIFRLAATYLPLTFSRRHGDPSRPWNRFSINIKKADGSQRLDYEGNWRDIFQNWEALAYSYPEYIEGMIFTFLSATTADGYNPYRITRAGLDWETPEPGNPWANIGYWSDHQIIYLQKLLELSEKAHPGQLRARLAHPALSYANVPYRIKPYADLLKDPYNTIEFDETLENDIEARVKRMGTDGKLVHTAEGQVLHRSLAEKLLTLLLAKLVNFVPEGGIWMNTQRPEWNDANNALVGKGLSVVTLGYLRRYVVFLRDLLTQETPEMLEISTEVAQLFAHIAAILEQFKPRLADSFTDEQRRAMMDTLGQAGSEYRTQFYAQGFSGTLAQLSGARLLGFLELTLGYIEHTLHANRRPDHLYHAYNTLRLEQNRASISRLYEMLEGQVSILSSGMLSGAESLALLQSLRASALYRPDQHTYILYPNKTLPGFLQKNSLRAEQVRGLRLPAALAEAQNKTLLVRDMDGIYHFAGHIRNGRDVRRALEALGQNPRLAALVASEGPEIASHFEAVFRHDEFTGRSGTFFGYEGLGSVYWHMVSKLLLAAQEAALRFPSEPGLVAAYRDIRAGLGFHKSPAVYGAFPTDPYSHTPAGQGARQPGMTGMVKEEILTRQAELGIIVENGGLRFDPLLLDRAELLTAPSVFSLPDGRTLEIPAGALAGTFCQTPLIIQSAAKAQITVHRADGTTQIIPGNRLDAETTRHIFQRDGQVTRLVISVPLQTKP